MQLIVFMAGYIMPEVIHVFSPVLFRIPQYLHCGLLQKLNPLFWVEVPSDCGFEMEGWGAFSVGSHVYASILLRN